MLAKKKSQKQKAIADAAVAERKKEISRLSKRPHGDADFASPTDASVSPPPSSKRPRSARASFASSAALSTDLDPTATLRALGDHVNTRLQALDFDDDVDADLFDDAQRQLREAAALAAGTRTRALAAPVAAALSAGRGALSALSAGRGGLAGLSAGRGALAGLSAGRGDLAGLSAGRGALAGLSGSGGSGGAVPMRRVGHNGNAVTAVGGFGADVVVLGDKSGAVFVARGGEKALLQPALPGAVLCIAVSDTRGLRPSQRTNFERSTVDTSVTSYIAAGAADGSIGVWVTETLRHVGMLLLHRAAVTGLAFRNDTLYSCSHDETLRVWSVPQMTCQDKLFGHQGRVLSVSCLKRERCATVGEDGTMRFWKIDAATQQEFKSSVHFGVKVVLECVAMINDSIILCGATNGSLLVFDVARRKPLVVCETAHGSGFVGDGTGLEREAMLEPVTQKSTQSSTKETRRQNPNPITAVAAMPYSDVAASASYDGVVRLWRLTLPDNTAPTAPGETAHTKFECFASIPIDAIVTALHFSSSCDALVIGCGKEPRLGRWVVMRRALNAAYVVPLSEETLRDFHASPDVEHIPAVLYGLEEKSDAEDSDAKPSGKNHKKRESEEEEEEERERGEEEEEEEEVSSLIGDDAGEDADGFTVGEDGQLEFNAPLQEPSSAPHGRKDAASKKNKTTNSKNNNKKKKKNAKKTNEVRDEAAVATVRRVKATKANTAGGKMKLTKKKK